MLSLIESDVTNVLDTKVHRPADRVQVYQKAEISTYSPSQEIRWNFPPIMSDFRDMYVQFDVELTGITAQVSEIFAWNSRNGSNTAVTASGGTFFLKLANDLLGPYVYNESDAVIKADIMASALIKELRIADADITVSNELSVSGQDILTITNNSPHAKLWMCDAEFYPVDVCLTDGTNRLDLCINTTISSSGNPQFPRLEYGIGSIIDRIEIEVNSTSFSECDRYNLLWNALATANPSQWKDTNGKLLSNYSPDFKRTWTNDKRFSFRLYGMEFFKHIYPLDMIPGIQLRLLIRLAGETTALVRSSTGAINESYSVKNPEVHYHTLKIDPLLRDQLSGSLEGDGLIYSYKSYQNFTDVLTGSSKDEIVNFSFQKFLGVLFVMREDSFIDDVTNDYKNSSFIKNFIGSYRLKIGQSYYPRDRVELINTNQDVVEAYNEYLRYMNLGKNALHLTDTNCIAGLNYDANLHTDTLKNRCEIIPPSFIPCISVDPHILESYHENNEASSGVNTSGQTNISLELRDLSITGSNQNTIDIFGKYNAFCVLTTNGATYVK